MGKMPYIHGFNAQGDLTTFFAKNENNLTQQAFYQLVLDWQQSDAHNYCADVQTAQEGYVFLSSGHDTRRAEFRSSFTANTLRQRCLDLLANQLIFAAVTEYPVYEDDNGKIAHTDDIEGVAVVDEVNGVVFIFEAGFSYIRLRTVDFIGNGKTFITDVHTKPIKLCASGFVETKIENIPEITIGEHDRAHKGYGQ